MASYFYKMGDYISSLLPAVIASAVLAYLARITQKQAAKDVAGFYTLRMHRIYFVVGLIAIIIAVIAIAAGFLTRPEGLMDILMICAIFIFFAGLGILSIFLYRKHYIRFDDAAAEVHGVGGNVNSFSWPEVIHARFNRVSGFLILKKTDQSRVQVHYHLIGFGSFLALLKTKSGIPSSELETAIAGMNRHSIAKNKQTSQR